MHDETASDPEGWVDRHGDSLYRYAMTRLGDPDRAADLVQETFLHALRAAGTFAGRSSERTWLVGILKHKLIDQYRAATRREAASPSTPWADFDEAGYWIRTPRAWAAEPSRAAEAREFWAAVGACLGKLPPGLADAFLLRELDGVDSAEIQRRLAITPANLWARLHRARSLLRRCLEAAWSDAESAPGSSPAPTPNRRKARSPDGPTR